MCGARVAIPLLAGNIVSFSLSVHFFPNDLKFTSAQVTTTAFSRRRATFSFLIIKINVLGTVSGLRLFTTSFKMPSQYQIYKTL